MKSLRFRFKVLRCNFKVLVQVAIWSDSFGVRGDYPHKTPNSSKQLSSGTKQTSLVIVQWCLVELGDRNNKLPIHQQVRIENKQRDSFNQPVQNLSPYIAPNINWL